MDFKIHRSEALDKLLGRRVKITFKDGTEAKGILGFVTSFGACFGYKQPGCYFINDLSFRKSHVKKIIPLVV